MHILIAVLLLILAIFGVASMMGSYATAKQAQATIEVAQVAQVNAWGNLIVILLLALVIVCVLAVCVWMVSRRIKDEGRRIHQRRDSGTPTPLEIGPSPLDKLDINTLIQLEVLRTLRGMRGVSTPHPSPLPQGGEGDVEDELGWLR